jgi:hypothetical protein
MGIAGGEGRRRLLVPATMLTAGAAAKSPVGAPNALSRGPIFLETSVGEENFSMGSDINSVRGGGATAIFPCLGDRQHDYTPAVQTDLLKIRKER